MAEPFYGTCMSIFDDMADPARTIEGQELLIQDVYHLLTTQRGSMATDPSFGFGLSDELLSGRDPATVPALGSSIQSALEDDDRIATADVTIAFNADGLATLDIIIEPTQGPGFRLVGPLSSLITELTGG